MNGLKQEIGNFLRLLGAFLATFMGCYTLDKFYTSSDGWSWLPKVAGSVLVLAGAAALVILLYRKTVRIKVDTAAEFSPGPDKQG